MSPTVWLLLGAAGAAVPDNFPLWRVYPRLPPSRSLALVAVSLPEASQWPSFILSGVHRRLDVPVTTHTMPSRVASVHHTQNYLLVAESATTLLNSIRQYQWPWHPRSQFILILVAETPPTDSNGSIYLPLFEYLWKTYEVLNAIAMTVRSDMGRKVVTYNPFLLEGDSRGQARVLDCDDAELFVDKTRDLHGSTFRASMFQRLPTAVLKDRLVANRTESCYDKADGVDGQVLSALARYMRFTARICEPANGTEYGYLADDNTFTGSLGDVLYGRADVAFNSRFIKGYKTDDIEFTPPIYIDNLCIVVPKAKRIPKWLKIFRSMQVRLMILLVVIFFGSVAFLYAMKRLRALYETDYGEEISLLAIWFDMLHPFLGAALVRVPSVPSQRVFVMACLLFSLVVLSAFQGKLVSAIRRTAYYRDINTLRELDESGLTVGIGSQNLDDTFTGTEDPTIQHLMGKLRYLEDGRLLEQIASGEKKMSAIVRKSDASVRMLNLTSLDGDQRLHLVGECPRVYFLSFVVRKGSPLLARIGAMLRRMTAAGLVLKWEADDKGSGPRAAEVEDQLKVFSLSDLQIAFYILAVGLTVSAVTLLTELKYRGTEGDLWPSQ